MVTFDGGIVAVTVYTDRARVTRQGAVHLPPGQQVIVLSNLPATLDEDSVRVSGKGTGAKILGIEVATEYVTVAPEENVAELRAKLEGLQDEDKAQADQDAACDARDKFLEQLRESSGHSFAKGLAYGNAPLERVQSIAEYLNRELTAVYAAKRGIAVKRRELKREIDAVQARLGQLRNSETIRRRDIQVAVEATAETDLELQVTYVVKGASWKPLYDIRLEGQMVSVSYLASVTQRSGEDWTGVGLSLSTARPATSTELPELKPWYLDTQRPAPPRVMMARLAAAPAAPPGGAPQAVLEDAVPESVPVAMATVETSEAAVTYRVTQPVTVPSDGAPHKTTVAVLDLTAQLDYVTAPKLAEEAYLRAKIKNTSVYILLPGSVNIFHGADFVGVTQLETIAPNEEFEAHLGVDDRIKVERELVERTVDKTLIGNTRRMVFAYKITLTNLLATPAKVTVLDQLPVARSEEIKVKPREISPKPASLDNLGILTWNLELKPQEKREVTVGFAVEYPREMRLFGITD